MPSSCPRIRWWGGKASGPKGLQADLVGLPEPLSPSPISQGSPGTFLTQPREGGRPRARSGRNREVDVGVTGQRQQPQEGLDPKHLRRTFTHPFIR